MSTQQEKGFFANTKHILQGQKCTIFSHKKCNFIVIVIVIVTMCCHQGEHNDADDDDAGQACGGVHDLAAE